VNLKVYQDPSITPTLVLVDLQQEYVESGRSLGISDTEQSLANCHALLQHARNYGLPVAFTRWVQQSTFFNNGQGYSKWIEGFEPHGSDMIFDRAMPSCYSNEQFNEMMCHFGGKNAIIAGFTGSIACLSTILDGFHKRHDIKFIFDASASHSLNGMTEGKAHESACDLISLYAPVLSTQEWIKSYVPIINNNWKK